MEGKGDVFDTYLNSMPNYVNYYERFMKGEKLKAGWANDADIENIPPVVQPQP